MNTEWRLVDALWGACDPKDPGDGKWRFQNDEKFFLTDAKDIIYTHMAGSPQWQLLDTPRPMDAFHETVCLKSRFFDFNMQVLSHPVCEIMCQDGEVDFLFGVMPQKSPVQMFKCYISFFEKPGSKKTLSKGSETEVPVFMHKPTDSSISFRIRFPDSGIFRIEIVGKDISKDSMHKQYDWIVVYKVIVGEPAVRGFPKMDQIGWGPGKEIVNIGLAPFNYTSGIIVAKNVQTKLRFKIIDSNLVQNMKFFFKMASTCGNEVIVNAVCDKFEIDLNIITFFVEAPPLGEYTLNMFARNVRGQADASKRKEVNICNYLLISDLQQRGSPLAVLRERTEIADDPGHPQLLTLQLKTPLPVQHRPKSDVSIDRQSEITESVVSASNVAMDTNSQLIESGCNSPEIAEPTDVAPTVNVPTEPFASKPMQSATTEPVLKRVPERKTVTQTVQETPTETKDGSPPQVCIHLDTELNEIPEIPLEVVKPVVANPDAGTAKREMKVVSTNQVVPLNITGGDDRSIMLVPADDKPKRPATGIKRIAVPASNTQFFTTKTHVNGM